MRLPVHLDVPAAVAPRVRYALGVLLHGLGLEAFEATGEAVLYVGTDPEASRAPVRLRLRPDAFAPAAIAAPDRLGSLRHGARRWPLPVGPGGTHDLAPGAVVEAGVVESAFWWLAGLGEAATRARDHHGRVRHANTLHAHLTLAEQPAVDGYRAWLGDALRDAGHPAPGRTWGGAPWSVALTHDVDALGAQRIRGAVGEVLRGRPGAALRRAGGSDTRRASIRALADLARRHEARSTFFWKGGASAREDVPHRLDASLLRDLAADGFEAGLHPSYHAHAHPARLAAEAATVARASGKAPVAVRSHFLRWREPATLRAYAPYRLDSTLGFAEAPGFRRGTAAPFPLYDRAADRATDLWELPLAVMDTSLFTHLGLDERAAGAALDEVFAAARAVGGCAVVLWHPDMGADRHWARRLAVLDAALGRARDAGARVGVLHGLARAWGAAV